jgi:hypothetical protein
MPPKAFQGVWDGVLSGSHVPKGAEPWDWTSLSETRIFINYQAVQVFRKVDGSWKESKPGKYRIRWFDTNAVITAIDSGKDSEGDIWVETHSYAVTRIDDEHLLVAHCRQVNNKFTDRSNPNAVWDSLAVGTLERIENPSPSN